MIFERTIIASLYLLLGARSMASYIRRRDPGRGSIRTDAIVGPKYEPLPSEKGSEVWAPPGPPKVPLLRASWSLLDGIWGLLKGSWGVLAVLEIL